MTWMYEVYSIHHTGQGFFFIDWVPNTRGHEFDLLLSNRKIILYAQYNAFFFCTCISTQSVNLVNVCVLTVNIMYSITQYEHLLYYIYINSIFLFLPGQKPEEKPPSPLLRSGSGALRSHSATALDPSNPIYRNYFTKIQAELSLQKSPNVSYKMSDEKKMYWQWSL